MTWSSLSPLRLQHACLPPSLVMAARIVALALVVGGDSPFRVYLPYFVWLDQAAPPEAINLTLRLAAGTGYLLILFSPLVRLGSGLAGGAYLIGLLACRPCHSVAHTYVACLLIILALSSHRTGAGLVRAQAVLLYAGAALNKTFDVDWWNGRYFETFLVTRHEHAGYIVAASWLPDGWLSTAMGIATVLTQWVLAWCFLTARWTAPGIAVGVVFHGAMVLLLNATFGPFFLALVATYIGLARWREGSAPVLRRGGAWANRAGWLATHPAVLLAATALVAGGAASGRIRNITIVAFSAALSPLVLRALPGSSRKPHPRRPEKRPPAQPEPHAG